MLAPQPSAAGIRVSLSKGVFPTRSEASWTVGMGVGGLVVTMVGRERGKRVGREEGLVRGERVGGWKEEVVRNVGDVKANIAVTGAV